MYVRCLDSLINQTFDDFEIICVDDGSMIIRWKF
ncbi:glycosyltransferase family A protein [uncultured Megasphaera sp.]